MLLLLSIIIVGIVVVMISVVAGLMMRIHDSHLFLIHMFLTHVTLLASVGVPLRIIVAAATVIPLVIVSCVVGVGIVVGTC